MKLGIKSALRAWREVYRFRSLPSSSRRIVFYSEGPESAPHLTPLIMELIGRLDRQICYVTSSPDDPVLACASGNILCFEIGSGHPRSHLFASLDAGLLVTTTPDLETMQLKRSAHTNKYVYIHHAIMSMHMVYRPGAFDHFDSLLCVGRHHVEEAKAAETIYGLKQREIVEHGSIRLDVLLQSEGSAVPLTAKSGAHVLSAPTWGDQALLETCGDELVDIIIKAGYQVTVRPHPMTMRHRSSLVRDLEIRFGPTGSFEIDRETESERSMLASNLLITDWSGIALEYAFALAKPIVFIELPMKVNNPDYQRIGLEPLELKLRSEIGTRVPTDQIGSLPERITALLNNSEKNTSRLHDLRDQWIFNVGKSATVGADYIAKLADQQGHESK